MNTYQNYLSLVVQTVVENIKPDSNYITAATLGNLLLAKSPKETWKDFGKSSLSELILDIQNTTGKLKLTKTEKGALAVSPEDGLMVLPSTAPKTNLLKKTIWDAFVLLEPKGKRFMNCYSGIVCVALNSTPEPICNWVEIPQIELKIQQKWAKEFVSNISVEPESIIEEIVDDNWHPQIFVKKLKELDASIAHLWNQFRTKKVLFIVQEWVIKHSIPENLVYQDAVNSNKVKTENSLKWLKGNQFSDTEYTRQIVLSAISKLPLEELLEIPLPAGILLSTLFKNHYAK
ncbi:hypothetical protein [Cardiobacterium hominis]|jgi:hypothetical protein|uniref:hypothetical protein n=1 Tax=Cardiobacterium hominis TaxID=2718 RepID=UPI0028E5E98C|nr:hypothetical protein [Cardiobacterium hominis]